MKKIFVELKLKTKYIGKGIHYFDEVNSTNEKANELAANVEEGTVIIAEKQKKGIGRFGREWISPEGGLYVSVILKPKISPINASKMALIAGMAVVKVVRKLGLDAKLKWPNDILIHGEKVGGILTSISTKEGKIDYVIVGIGINVNIDISTFPKKLQKSVTSLKEEFKKPIKAFINKIDGQERFKVKRNNMSTSIFGDYKEVMQWITDNMEESLLDDENAVFVLKIVGGNYYRD